MRNPLIRRIPREIVSDWHKYLVIIVFMVVMIGVISGMYVGHDSMLASIDAGRTELNLEDGCFELSSRASKELLSGICSGEMADVRQYYIDKGMKEADKKIKESLKDIPEFMKAGDEYRKSVEDAYRDARAEVIKAVDEEWDKIAARYELDDDGFFPVAVSVYEHFYRDETEDSNSDGIADGTVRIYKSDSQIDRAAFIQGRAPEGIGEIAIDRKHADNAGITVGDTITVGSRKLQVVGLLSYVNYLTLHQNNTDMMFDSFGFDVGMVTPESFDKFSSRVHYSYSWKYQEAPSDKIEKADHSECFLKALISQTLVNDNELKDYIPEYLRQASNFAPSDIEGDSVGTTILCYILIAVIAFIFAVTISNTIDREASVIGTLRASGYSRTELVVHYMSMPALVTIIGAAIGNALGYTAFKDVAVNLYYNSYSLPPCSVVWSRAALIKTTVIPLVLMFLINLIVITRKLQLSPLRFLRHDLGRSKKTKARRLPAWSFLRRFRLRVLLQNLPNYAILIFGVIFIELMLCFAFGLPDSLTNYGDRAPDMIFADYQYMLMGSRDKNNELIQTSEPSAESFSAKTLMYPKSGESMFEGRGSGGDEKINVYGIRKNSAYISLEGEQKDGDVYVSSAFSSKFALAVGDEISLHEEYENRTYSFTVAGIVDYDGGMAVFMDKDAFNRVFGMEQDEFSGFFSRHEITDIDEQYIATVITTEDIAKVTVQLMHSLGGFLSVFKYALVVLSMALIYLLAKIIIEKNENPISMSKILGFRNGEIASLYMLPTGIVVTVCALIGFVAGFYIMKVVFKAFILSMDGYFPFYMKPSSMVLAVVYLLIGYALVSVIDYRRIRKIPMDVALKNVD
jgi:putative ABC transport system permease protein